MIKLVGRAFFAVISNMIALYAAGTFISGFGVAGDLAALAGAGAILAVLNFLLRPLLKLFFGPLMVLTFGLFAVVVNALILYLLDMASGAVTIEGYVALVLGALVIGIVNAVLHVNTKR